MKKPTDQDRWEVEEAWAKFASLFRDRADAATTTDAAIRFLTKTSELGVDFPDMGILSAKDLSVLGLPGMSMAATGLAENVVRIALLEVQIKTLSENVLKLLAGLSTGMEAESKV